MSALLERLQASLGEVASHDREVVRVAPFTAYVDNERPLKYFSFALPDAGSGEDDLRAALAGVRDAFSARGRVARIEHVEELNPELRPILEDAGWVLSERMPVMTCTAEQLAMPSAPEGLVVERIDRRSPESLVRAFLATQKVAFEDPHGVTDVDVAKLLAMTEHGHVFAGLIGDEVVGTGLASRAVGGVAEVAGVSTLPDFRRRGIAGALTAAAAAAAFEAGAELAWLTAADEGAARIYGRAGFQLAAVMWAHDAPAAEGVSHVDRA